MVLGRFPPGPGAGYLKAVWWCKPALQHEPRRSRGVPGPSLAENLRKTGPKNSSQTAFRYPASEIVPACARKISAGRIWEKGGEGTGEDVDPSTFYITLLQCASVLIELPL